MALDRMHNEVLYKGWYEDEMVIALETSKVNFIKEHYQYVDIIDNGILYKLVDWVNHRNGVDING